MTYDGLVPVITAMADVPDAVAFEDYVATAPPGWTRRSAAGPPLPWSLGMLGGRHGDAAGEEEGVSAGVMVFVHTRPGQAMAGWTPPGRPPPSNRSARVVQRAGTKVTIRPVIDLAEEMATDAYPHRADGRAGQAPFPGECRSLAATRPSRPGLWGEATDPADRQQQEHGSDLDHRREWPEPNDLVEPVPTLPGPPPASRPGAVGPANLTRSPVSPGPSPLGFTTTDPGSSRHPRLTPPRQPPPRRRFSRPHRVRPSWPAVPVAPDQPGSSCRTLSSRLTPAPTV